MKITLNALDSRSIERAIKDVQEYKGRIHAKTAILVEHMTSDGMEMAQESFDNSMNAGPESDVNVVKVPTGELSQLVRAVGDQALFIEFGTGAFMRDNPAERADISAEGGQPVAHGEYGKGLGKNWVWRYRGEPHAKLFPGTTVAYIRRGRHRPGWMATRGQWAQSPMWKTKNRIAEDFSKMAREVFDKD